MGIQIKNLKKRDKGKWVTYNPPHRGPLESGRIKSWNDEWIFVVYKCDDDWDDYTNYTGCATNPSELYFGGKE